MQQYQEEQVPAMAEHVGPSSDKHYELSLSYLKAYFGLTKYDENEEPGNEFVFNIDRSLLIDPRRITYGHQIGEGPHSIVYEGLWVSLFANSNFSFDFRLGCSHCLHVLELSYFCL